jgi:hypothetical protein
MTHKQIYDFGAIMASMKTDMEYFTAVLRHGPASLPDWNGDLRRRKHRAHDALLDPPLGGRRGFRAQAGPRTGGESQDANQYYAVIPKRFAWR